MPNFLLTTSWDDGHCLDERLADGLDGCHLAGTFYVARDYIESRLSEAQIKALAQRHEIGAHTVHHPDLTAITLDDGRCEIVDSREWLQQVTGQAVSAFCYPRGRYTPAVRQLVADAGFSTARTVSPYQMAVVDRFAMPVTMQVYPFPLRPVNSIRARFQPLQTIRPHLATLKLPLMALRSWPGLAEALLRRAAQVGGVWHLWGHSWEIERYEMWPQLARVLALAGEYVQNGSARAVTNTELAHIIFDDQPAQPHQSQPAPVPYA